MKFKMKTLLFYVFYSENKKKYYLIKSSMIDLEVIHKIIKRRLNLSEKNIIELKKITPTLRWVALAGGEPTLSQPIKNYLKFDQAFANLLLIDQPLFY